MTTVGKHGVHEELATKNTILRVRTGSAVHGISSESSDRDEVGVCVEPPEYVIGLRGFEQYQFRTAAQRTGKFDARSYAGDLDLTIYSLRKFTMLALNGNPSIIETLFVPAEFTVKQTLAGEELQELYPLIVSKEAAPRYLGYLMAQRRSMQSREGKGRDVTRPELVAKYGFDTKYAGHMIRLGLQGCELLRTGKISLPMDPKESGLIRKIRQGEFEMTWCLDYAAHLEDEIKALTHRTNIPDHPDRDAVNAWLVQTYQAHWGFHEAGPDNCWEW